MSAHSTVEGNVAADGNGATRSKFILIRPPLPSISVPCHKAHEASETLIHRQVPTLAGPSQCRTRNYLIPS